MTDQNPPSSSPAQPGIDQTSPERQPGEVRSPAALQQDQKLQEASRQQGATVPGETVPRNLASKSNQGRGDSVDHAAAQPARADKIARVDPIGGDTGAQS